MKRSKHGLFVFPRENPNIEKALFDWPIMLQCGVKAKYRLISRKFSSMTVFQPSVRLQSKATRVCIRSIKQSNRSFFAQIGLNFVHTKPVNPVTKTTIRIKTVFRPFQKCADSCGHSWKTSKKSRKKLQNLVLLYFWNYTSICFEAQRHWRFYAWTDGCCPWGRTVGLRPISPRWTCLGQVSMDYVKKNKSITHDSFRGEFYGLIKNNQRGSTNQK